LLNQAMGIEGPIDYDVADQSLGPTPGEDAPTEESIAAVAGAVEGGAEADKQSWNAQVGISLTWNLYQGGLTGASAREAEARIQNLVAQVDSERQQIRLQVEQVRLALAAAKASQGSSAPAGRRRSSAASTACSGPTAARSTGL
jgi:hypothetical protein